VALNDPGSNLALGGAARQSACRAHGCLPAASLPRVSPIFERNPHSGRVDLVRTGNTVRATTRGVEQFTLLCHRTAFDFSSRSP
jgi:hypothetical protein